jgi:hypothetical protein
MMTKANRKFLLISLAAGVVLAGATLAASVWGSLTMVSFVQDSIVWRPAGPNLRLLMYCLAGWVSLLPAVIVVCVPLGFALGRSGTLSGFAAGMVSVIVWFSLYSWSVGPPSLLYYSEILGVITLSTLLAMLGGALRRRLRKEDGIPVD